MKNVISLTVLTLIFSLRLAAQDDSQQFVRLGKAKTDEAYAKILEHHRCVKAYLNSPLKGDPKLEDLLLLLLKNGFSIEDLDKAFFALRAPAGRPTASPDLEELMLQQGVPPERVGKLAESVRQAETHQRRKIVKMLTGVEDEAFLDALLELAPKQLAVEEIGALRVSLPVEGERILTDAEWMTEDHRMATASYKGEARRMFPRGLSAGSHEMAPMLVPRAHLP